MSEYQSTRKKNFPCLRCNQHVKKTEKAVQCALCDLWVHKLCENMSDETFRVLDTQNKEQGQCFWSCKSCHSYALKFDKRMRDVEKRVEKLETERIPVMEKNIGGMHEEIDQLKRSTDDLKDASKEGNASQSSITAAVLEEMRERESRRCNLIVHNLDEPGSEISDSKERIGKDIEKLQELLNQVEADVNVSDCQRFVKRLGPRSDAGESPRPLLIGFKEKHSCDLILERSSKLADKEEPWSSINIIRDLTKSQRKEEKEMRAAAEKKNNDLSEEEKENWVWKVAEESGK